VEVASPSEARDPLASTTLCEPRPEKSEQPPGIHRRYLRPPAQRLHHQDLLLWGSKLEVEELYLVPQALLHLQIDLASALIFFSIP
jgi:hypothetical protein